MLFVEMFNHLLLRSSKIWCVWFAVDFVKWSSVIWSFNYLINFNTVSVKIIIFSWFLDSVWKWKLHWNNPSLNLMHPESVYLVQKQYKLGLNEPWMMFKLCLLIPFELVFNLVRRFHERLYQTCRRRQKKTS